jgi:hypothetical protein
MSSISANRPIHGMFSFRLFRRDPQPQAKRNQRHGADAAEPKHGEPQQTLRQRPLFWFDPSQ